MSSTLPIQEGFLPFRGYRTWYRIVGDLSANKTGMFPLVTLHGGPGATHYGLIPLEKITETGRAVIFYDQLGCGSSDRPDDSSIWSVKLFLDELIAIRRELGLDQIHLFGHSWGGMLAMEYVLTQPSGVLSLVLASCSRACKLPQLAHPSRSYTNLVKGEIARPPVIRKADSF